MHIILEKKNAFFKIADILIFLFIFKFKIICHWDSLQKNVIGIYNIYFYLEYF